eukprot:TRINITY_DN2509_c0_g1_i1.p1 TRINITY_DN2509_c0_g1~~TRINITY_DN2509_c0_g1_i1.p1  ORF type:complete len:620 (-),score=243.51 TRINITY_DN2509_c0_g1_i1:27-1886(-)
MGKQENSNSNADSSDDQKEKKGLRKAFSFLGSSHKEKEAKRTTIDPSLPSPVKDASNSLEKSNLEGEKKEEDEEISEKKKRKETIVRSMDRRERRKAILHPTQFPMEEGTETAAMVIKWYKNLDDTQMLLAGMSLTYAMAYLGWGHWSYMLVILFFVIKREMRKQSKQEVALRKQIDLDHQKALITTSAEGSLWLNDFIQRMLPQIKQMLTDTMMQSIKQSVENYLDTAKPPALESIVVNNIEFGEATPMLMETVTFNLQKDFQTEFDLKYDSRFKVEATIGLGGKFVSVPFPIMIKNIKLIGRMRLTIAFCDTLPFLKVVTVAFKAPPLVELDIKPLKSFDIMDISVLKQYLAETIQNALIGLLVLPNRLTLQLQGEKIDIPKEIDPVQQQEGMTTLEMLNPATHVMGAFRAGVKATQFITKTKEKAAIAKTNGIIVVHLHKAIELISADSNGLSDPYIVIKAGELSKKSHKQKKTLNPVFDEVIELRANFKEDRELDFEIFDWNQFESHLSLGVYQLNLEKFLLPDTAHIPHDLELPLTLRDMQAKDNLNRGKIFVTITCKPEPPTEPKKKKDKEKTKRFSIEKEESTSTDHNESPDKRSSGFPFDKFNFLKKKEKE